MTARWQADDAAKGGKGPWHVRHDRPDGTKVVSWEDETGKAGLGDHRLEDLAYGLHDAVEMVRWGDAPIVITEGEKAADAVRAAGSLAAATVCGAAATPGPAVIERFRGLSVILWYDADDVGRDHMNRIGRALERAGVAELRVVRWPDAPEHGDAADLPAERIRELVANAAWAGPVPSFGGDIDASQSPAGMDGTNAELRWRSPRELVMDPAAAVEWAALHYVAFGAVTEVISSPKCGKTTLILDLVAGVTEGRTFLGRLTTRTSVVILTEQAPPSYRQALLRHGLQNRDDVRILLWRDARGRTWPDIVAAAVAECRRIGARLLIIDTLPAWAGIRGDAENDAGHALEAMEPVQMAAADGLAVVVVRHLRKGGALELADAGRGSSAFSGAVDVVLRLSRKDGGSRPTIRVLHALSRFDETPPELVIELVDGRYVVLGDQFDVEMSEARAAILAQLAGDGVEMTLAECVRATESSRTTLDRALKAMVDEGVLAVDGRGVKGDPRRFRLAARDSIPGEVPFRDYSSPGTESNRATSVSERMAELFDVDLETQRDLDATLGGVAYPATSGRLS